jgi:type 1 glutamine amidotransferase
MLILIKGSSNRLSRIIKSFTVLCSVIFIIFSNSQLVKAQNDKLWITCKSGKGPGIGKSIVLISGDQEYRSEEALPELARILAKENGFKTTVLFPVNPKTGYVDPGYHHGMPVDNIPGLKHLQSADLMIIFTRWQHLPDSQMKYIAQYVQAGKPIIGLRTATHAFRYPHNSDSPYAKYSYDSNVKGWINGFGRRVFGETWISHHGINYKQGTRCLINGAFKRENLAILRGVHNFWVPSGTYTSHAHLGKILAWGIPTNGMSSESDIDTTKTIMPVAWTRQYISDKGNIGRVFATTLGAAVDLKSKDLRQLIVNACYWALGMGNQIPKEGSNVKNTEKYNPTMFGMNNYKKGLSPSDYK